MAEGSFDGNKKRSGAAAAGAAVLTAGLTLAGIREGSKPQEQSHPKTPQEVSDIFSEHRATIASPEMYADAAALFGGSERQWRVPYSVEGDPIEYALMFDTTMSHENGNREATIKIPEGVLANIVKAGDLGAKKYLVVGQENLEIPGVSKALFYFKESPITQQYNTAELAGLWKEVTYDPETNEWVDKTDWSQVDEAVVKNPPDVPGKVTDFPEISTSAGLTPEQKELVEVTARHLTKVYGDTMDPESYPDEDSKLAFFVQVTEMGLELNPDNPNLANQIAAAMNLETIGTFSPKIKNPNTGATGLIQFMPDFAPGIVGKTTDELASMSPIEQLPYVKRYLDHWQSVAESNGKEKMRTVSDVYWAIFGPKFMGESSDKVAYPSGSSAAAGNQVHDLNKDGAISVGEAVQNVIHMAVDQGEKEAFLTSDGSSYPEASSHESLKTKMERTLETVGADREVMEQIVASNIAILNNPPADVPPGFGKGWCLLGVRLTLEAVYPDFQNVLLYDEHGNNVGSAYKARERFESHPEFFQNVPIDSLKDLYSLQPGSIIVYPPGNSNYDLVNGVHHGHISVVIENDFKGHVQTSSDHMTTLDTDLVSLALDRDTLPTVWVPVKQKE